MSYTVTVSGHVTADNAADAQAVEQTIVDSLKATIAALPESAGVSSASGSFQYLGSQNLLPEPPAPPAPTLAEAVDELTAAVTAAPAAAADGSVTFTADEFAALHKAVTDVETASQPAAAEAPAPAAAADTPTLAPAQADAVAL